MKFNSKLVTSLIMTTCLATSSYASSNNQSTYTLKIESTTNNVIPFTGSLMLIQKNGSHITRLDDKTPFSVTVSASTLAIMLQDMGEDNFKVEVLDANKNVKLGSEGRAMFIHQDADGSGTIISK